MSARLDEFGREYSKCTVIGGESFIQFRHFATDGRRGLNQINAVAQFSKVEGGLDTRYSAPYYHYCAHFFVVYLRSTLIHAG